jgi:hypothetical protein
MCFVAQGNLTERAEGLWGYRRIRTRGLLPTCS